MIIGLKRGRDQMLFRTLAIQARANSRRPHISLETGVHSLRQLAAAIGFVLLAACGGGGGGGGQLSVSPRSLSFEGETNGPTSPGQDVTVTFVGDGVIGGYAPGVAVPDWLRVETVGESGNTATFRFSLAHTDYAAGTYRTTFRFLTGREDGSNLKTYDMPVTLTMRKAGVIATDRVDFSALSLADTLPAPHSIDIGTGYSQMNYTATVSYSGGANGWLSGVSSGTAPRVMQMVPNTTALAPGEYLATIRLVPTSGRSRDIAVVYTVTPALLQPDPLVTSKTITVASSASDLSTTVQIGDSGARIQWRVIDTSASWLKASPSSGNSRDTSTLTLSFDRDFVLSAENGDYTGYVNLAYGNSLTSDGTYSYPVTLSIRLPDAHAVGPRFIEAGQVEPVVVYGKALTGMGDGSISLCGKAATSVQVLSDTAVRFTPPSLAVGNCAVQLGNALGSSRAGPKLQVGQTPAYTDFSLKHPAEGGYGRTVYDPKRKAVYGNYGESGVWGGVHRFSYNGSTWVRDQIVGSAFRVNDIALSADGNFLYLSSRQNHALYAVNLDNTAATPTTLTTQMGEDHIVTMGDGRILGASMYYARSIFDPRTGELTYPSMDTDCPGLQVSADGSRVLLLNGGCVSPAHPNFIFDVPTNTHRSDRVANYVYQNMGSINRTGSQIATYQTIFDDSFGVLGSVGGGFAILYSLDSKRLYSLTADDDTGLNARLVVSDVSTPPTSGGTAAVLKTIPIPDAAPYSYYSSTATLTPDGKHYILVDKDYFRVIPLAD